MRKKSDLLTTGLSSELFLLAYLEPNNVRQLAQKLQNTSRHPTNYSKAYPAVHDLAIAEYLKFNPNDEKHYVNIKKLVKELESILNERNMHLNDNEKLYLEKILEQNEFFKIMSQDVVKKIQDQEKGVHKINALEVFCERIGGLSAGALIQKKFSKNNNLDSLYNPKISFEENIKEIQDILDELHPAFDKIKHMDNPLLEHPAFKEVMLPFLKHMDTVMIFFLIPSESLEKLMRLWNQSDGVKFALHGMGK